MMDESEAAAILGDDGLDEFFGNGELSPTFFENENLLLSPNASAADPTVLSPSLVSNAIGPTEAWTTMPSTSQPAQTIVQQIPQTGAITVQHTAPNGGTTHLVVGPSPYQVQSKQDSDQSSLVVNQNATMPIQQHPFTQPNIQVVNQQSSLLQQQQQGQGFIQSYVQQPQQFIGSSQQVTNQSLPQRGQPRIVQGTETTKKKKPKKKNTKAADQLKTTNATSYMTISQPPTPPVPPAPQETSFTDSSQTQSRTNQSASGSSMGIQPQPYQLGQALPPGQQLMIVNAQGQLQPLTQEQLALVRMQQASMQQQPQQPQQIVQSAVQETAQPTIQVAGQSFQPSTIGNSSVASDLLEPQSSNIIPIQQTSSIQTANAMPIHQQQQQQQQQQPIQLLQTSQGSSVSTALQQSALPQQQIIQTANGQQVLIQTPQANNALATGQQMIRGGGQFVQTAPQYVPGPNNTYINIGCQLISLSGVRQGAPSSGTPTFASQAMTASSAAPVTTTTTSTTSAGVSTVADDSRIQIQLPTTSQAGTRIVVGPGGQAMAVQSQNVIQMANGQQFLIPQGSSLQGNMLQMANGQQFLLPQGNNMQGNAVQSFLLPNGQQIVLPQQNQSMIARQQAMTQQTGQQTVQYLRQPNGTLIPIGVAPPMAMSSSSTPTNSASVDQNMTDKSSVVASEPNKSQKATSPSALLPVSNNSSLTTTVTVPTNTMASTRVGYASQQVVPSTTQQPSQVVLKSATPPTMTPQTQNSTQIPGAPQTQPPKQQFQTIQLSWESHQKLAKIQEEMKKLQGQKVSDKQMKQLQHLQVEQQKILAEGKPVSVVPSASTSSDSPQLPTPTSSQQIVNNQGASIVSTQSFQPSPQPMLVQTQAGSAGSNSSQSASLPAPSVSTASSSPGVRPPGGPQAPNAQQTYSVTIGPRTPGSSGSMRQVSIPLSSEIYQKLQKLPLEQQHKVIQQLVEAQSKKQQQTTAAPIQKPRPPKPPVFSAQLKKDQSDLINSPDIKTPFKAFRDVAERLAKYHVYQSYEPSQEHEEAIEGVFGTVSDNLLTKAENMMERFRYVVMRGSMRKYSASESVMLERLWGEKERREMAENKKAAQESPEAYFERLPKTSWEDFQQKLASSESEKEETMEQSDEDDIIMLSAEEESTEETPKSTSTKESATRAKRNMVMEPPSDKKRRNTEAKSTFSINGKTVTAAATAAQGLNNSASMKPQPISTSSDSFSVSQTITSARDNSGVDSLTKSRTDDSIDAVKPADVRMNPKRAKSANDSGMQMTKNEVGARDNASAVVSADAAVPDNAPNSADPLRNEGEEMKDVSANDANVSAVHSKNDDQSPDQKFPNESMYASTSSTWNEEEIESGAGDQTSTSEALMTSSIDDAFMEEQSDAISSLLEDSAATSDWPDESQQQESPDGMWQGDGAPEVHSYDDEVDAAIKNILF